MIWKNLSRDAKNILEWTENPTTNERELLKVVRGENFQMHSIMGNTDIFVTDEIWNEIKVYCEENKDRNNLCVHDNTLYISLRAPGMVLKK
ncbi:hypothetical protein D3C87_81710 [compost metagenome]